MELKDLEVQSVNDLIGKKFKRINDGDYGNIVIEFEDGTLAYFHISAYPDGTISELEFSEYVLKYRDSNIEKVLEWFNLAMEEDPEVYIYMWHEGYVEAWEKLIKLKILKEEYLGEVYVGTSYKGYLFQIEHGCEERLFCAGKI